MAEVEQLLSQKLSILEDLDNSRVEMLNGLASALYKGRQLQLTHCST